MGKSAYKLLHKHGLLERFISEYPSCIKISDFREYIIEGKGNGYEELPLPQGSTKPGSKNTAYKNVDLDSLPQGNSKAGANNIPSNDSNSILNKGRKAKSDGVNNATDGSYSSLSGSLAKAESILSVYPIRHKDGSDISLLSTVQEVLEQLEAEGISNPVGYLINEIENLDRKQVPPPQEFFESLLHGEEIPF